MRLLPSQKLFFGLKIDSKMREGLGSTTPGNRHYFDDPNSPYLRVLPNGDEQWIGKLVEGGLAPGEVEDIQRNVLSILNRIAPAARASAAAMRIFSVDESPAILNSPGYTPRGSNDYGDS